jgi:sialic acid synthase SpsE/mannose-6-phosphate isomerase-like protein (cupin superfamily)
MKNILVILEIANNHMGDFGHAKKIINSFSKLKKKYSKKIDFAFKFQFRDLNTFINQNYAYYNKKSVERFESTKLSSYQWSKIINYTRKKFKIICTAFDELSVKKINKFKFHYLKIASCSMNDWPLIETVSRINKLPIICSLGGASLNDIRKTISFFSNKNINVKYLYCVAKYPTEKQNLNLTYFKYLRDIYGEKICGFSTHERPNETMTGAIAYTLGARIFEKHVNINNTKYKMNDYSATPKQLDIWLKNILEAKIINGLLINRENFLKQEKINLRNFQRGVYLKPNKILKTNEKVTLDKIDIKFPNKTGQLVANDLSKFKTFIVKKKIYSSKPILCKDLKVVDMRFEIEKIRNKVLDQIDHAKIIVNNSKKIEISYHYGLENFYKFGLCMITIVNKNYCKKLLFLFKGQKHPAQYHKKKTETFEVLFGDLILITKLNGKSKKRILKSGDIYTIQKKEIHEFTTNSKNGCIIEEISTRSIRSDSYYLDKKINLRKKRKSYISLY